MARPRVATLLAKPAVGGLVLLAVIAGAFFSQPHTPVPEDARKVAYDIARDVALATDDDVVNDETPDVPSCAQALDEPTDQACRLYEETLADFLEDAQEPCVEKGYLRAEDLSCVPESFYDRETRGDPLRGVRSLKGGR